MDRTVDEVRALARKLDELDERRRKLTADIDAEVAQVEAQLRALIDPRSSKKAPKKKRASKLGDQIIAALAENGAMPHAEIAKRVYGSNTDATRHKVRAQIFNLKEGGRIRRDGSSGPWTVVLANGAAGDHTMRT